MKIQRLLVITSAILLGFCMLIGVGTVEATLIDFDDVAGSGIRAIDDDRYLSEGILLSTDGSGLFVYGPADYAHTPPDYLYASSSSGGFFADAGVIVDFICPGTLDAATTDFVSFYLVDAQTGIGQEWTASVFDFDNNLLDSLSGNTNDEIQISFAVPGIHRLVISPSPDHMGIDTLEFNEPAPVPEPATILLIGSGLIGLAGFRKKFRRD